MAPVGLVSVTCTGPMGLSAPFSILAMYAPVMPLWLLDE